MKNKMQLRSQSAQVILDAALQKGIKVDIISKQFQLLKLSLLTKSIFIKGVSLPVNSQPACFIANNKFLTKNVFKLFDIPTPKSWLVKNPREAKKIALENAIYPCVLKPARGAHGHGVYANIESFKEFNDILPLVFDRKGDKNVLIEKFINGKDYRLLVVGNKVSAVLERIPAHVVGDGVNSIGNLIEIFNNNPLVGEKYEKPLCKIVPNGEINRNLKKQNIKLTHVPKKGDRILLRQNANISTGGIGRDATDEVGEDIKAIAVKAAQAIGIVITGVDIIYDSINNKAYVLELNDTPGIDIHHFPVYGKPRNVASDIVNYLFNLSD